MAGEYSLQNIPKLGADLSLVYGTNPAFGMGADDVPVNTSDEGSRQFRLAFQDTKTEKTPPQTQNITSDNNIGKFDDAAAQMNKYYFNLN